MPLHTRILTFLTVLVMSSLLVVPEAHSQDEPMKILLLSFKGPTGKNTRNRLVKELSTQPGVKLVARKEALTKGQELGIPADSTKPVHLAKIGEALGYDAAVTGEITSIKGGPKQIELVVIPTLDPAHTTTLTFTWTTETAPESTIEQMAAAVIEAVGAAQSEEVIGPYVPPPTPGPGAAPPPPGTTAPKPKKTYGKGQILFVQAGMVLVGRKLAIAADPPPDIEYDGGAFPAIDAELRFFPARIATSHPAAGIGLGLAFMRSFAVTSRIEGSSTSYDSALTALDIKLIYEFPLGRTPLWLSFNVGWGFFNYTIDTGAVTPIAVSSFQYKNVILGTNLRIVAIDPWLTVEVGGDVRILHDVGDATNAYGGEASGVGGTARLGLTGNIIKGFSWGAGFEYTGMGTKFSGDCSNPVNCTLGKASKAADHYPAGWLRLGYTW